MKIMLLTLIIGGIFLPIYIMLLKKIRFVQKNFNNKEVPISIGIFIFLVEASILFINNNLLFLSVWPFLLAIAIVGTIDDQFGERNIKGLLNHFKQFFRGRVTTGFIKAATGGLISLLISLEIGNNIFEYITHFLLILFMINTINLFDLRPGRALKVFFLFSLILVIATPLVTSQFALVTLSLMLIIFYYDVRGKVMMGDSGSNIIGLHLGIWYSFFMSLQIQWLLIIALFFLHIYTEKYSLSKLIERNKTLLKVDLWLRKDQTIE